MPPWDDVLITGDLAGRPYGLLITLETGSAGSWRSCRTTSSRWASTAWPWRTSSARWHQVAISDPERGDMLALARQIKMDDPVPRALGSCPQAS